MEQINTRMNSAGRGGDIWSSKWHRIQYFLFLAQALPQCITINFWASSIWIYHGAARSSCENVTIGLWSWDVTQMSLVDWEVHARAVVYLGNRVKRTEDRTDERTKLGTPFILCNPNLSMKIFWRLDNLVCRLTLDITMIIETSFGVHLLLPCLPSKLSFWVHLEGKTRQRKINSDLFLLDDHRNI